MEKQRLVIGMSGASGAPLLIKCLELLQKMPEIETHLIISRGAEETIRQETTYTVAEIKAMADVVYDNKNIGAGPASGTFKTMGMLVVPCSMKTLAGIHSGYSDTLLLRAADVTIKEQRKLILVARETPLSQIHLRNLYELSMVPGVRILPPMLSYYHIPDTVEEMTTHMAYKILDAVGIDCSEFKRWKG